MQNKEIQFNYKPKEAGSTCILNAHRSAFALKQITVHSRKSEPLFRLLVCLRNERRRKVSQVKHQVRLIFQLILVDGATGTTK